ncbi:hypothetical protein MPER_03517, partial [Moniliophthora perniciosa FA553]
MRLPVGLAICPCERCNKERIFMLPHSLRRGFRNNGTTDPVVFDDDFRVYAVLAHWSPYSWTLDCYVLDDNNDVVFTFEGLHFEMVQQDDAAVNERFSMIWQPRGLPESHLHGDVNLVDESSAEVTELLEVLDKLALGYTKKALSRLPQDFQPTLPDRKRYVSWATQRTSGCTPESTMAIDDVSPEMREKYASLFELTQRVGEGQTDIFIDSKAAVDILFRDDLMSRIYEHPPFIGSVFDEAVKQFVKACSKCASGWVGAGTGRFTAMLGQALLDAKLELCYVDYVCTDISITLAPEATAKSPWTTIVPAAFDLNSP